MTARTVISALVVLLVVASVSAGEAPDTSVYATAYVSQGVCTVVPGIVPNGTAMGRFDPVYTTTGWYQLELSTGLETESSTLQQAFAVGCLESYFTHHYMYQFHMNYFANNYGGGPMPQKVESWLQEQQNWLEAQIAAEVGSGKAYWQGMAHLMAQFDGLVAGYQQFAPEPEMLSRMDIYAINSVGDLETLNGLFNKPAEAEAEAAAEVVPNHDSGIPNAMKDMDCSGFIKILPDNSDIIVAHSTWTDFYGMLRVFKIYNLGYAPSKTVSMSSKPGFLHSKDDFYATPNTVVIETTNSVFNQSLFSAITVECALSWQRAAVSVQWGTTGQQWTELFAMYNSGTYNNQWMVVDTSAFTPGSPPPTENLLWILEQIPGQTKSGDVTSVLLKQSYWASYNIPYFTEIYDISGYPAVAKKMGSPYVYDDCQRANIFRRNQTQVTDMEHAQLLMRYNNYEHDPLSLGDPVLGGVCARGDLQAKHPVPFGCVDSKVTSAKTMSSSVQAISGPTHVQQPVFVWDPKFESTPHMGVNNVWDFEWVAVTPSLGPSL